MASKRKKIAAVACGLIVSSSAVGYEAGSRNWGGIEVIPTLGVDVSSESNPFSKNVGGSSSIVTRISPAFEFLAENGGNSYAVTMGAVKSIIHDSRSDDTTDFHAEFSSVLSLGVKSRLDLQAGIQTISERRGELSTQGLADFVTEPTEGNQSAMSGTWIYGAESARGRLQLTAGYNRLTFSNNEAFNASRERRDFNYGAKFLYAIGGATDLTFSIDQRGIKYLNSAITSLDSKETKVAIGAQWEITGKTTGSLSFGSSNKDFDSLRRTDPGSTGTWDAEIEWTPVTYASISLLASRSQEETTGAGDFIEQTSFGLGWRHIWGNRITSYVSYENAEQTYIGSSQDDEIDKFSVGATYAWRNWMSLGVSYRIINKASSINSFAFDNDGLAVTIDLSL